MAAIVPYRAKTINNNLPVLAFDKSKIRLIENHLFVKNDCTGQMDFRG